MFVAVASGHFVVDVLNSVGAVLLAVLAVPLGLSNAQIGLALTIYLLVGSLSQPLFGWLSDKVPGRTMLLAAASVVWMAVFYALVAFAPTWELLLPVFLLAPLGSGLFHPIGAAGAALAAPDRPASATSFFFFFGQIGLAVGPFLAGSLAGAFGAVGIMPLAALALIPAGILLSASGQERGIVRRTRSAASRPKRVWTTLAIAVVAGFVVLVAVRSSVQQVYMSFLPKLFSDRGWDPALYGLMAGVFMGAGAIGQVISGTIADRFGMRTAIVWPLLAGVPAGLLCLLTPSIPLAFVACAFTGLLIGGQHSVLVVHAQQLLPVKQGFAAGLILGFTFATGAIGTWFAGLTADRFDLTTVMVAMTLLGLPAALLAALTLPGRHVPEPVPASAAAD